MYSYSIIIIISKSINIYNHQNEFIDILIKNLQNYFDINYINENELNIIVQNIIGNKELHEFSRTKQERLEDYLVK